MGFPDGHSLNHTETHMKKTAKTDVLSALDDLIAQTIELPRQPDEFTIIEYCERCALAGQIVNPHTALDRLKKMEAAGKLTSRKIPLKGTRTNLFRIIKP